MKKKGVNEKQKIVNEKQKIVNEKETIVKEKETIVNDKDMQKQKQKQRQTPDRFWKIIQAGDTIYLSIITYAILLFGCTKHGKTTLSHFFANHVLEPYKQDNRILYKVSPKNGQMGCIGNELHSQTQIPNKFQSQLLQKNQKIYIIDNPGYNDSFGIYRVLSNAYFHYRILSKVENIKFVLVIDNNTLVPPFCDIHSIFKEFMKSFKNLDNVFDQIIMATSVVITKVKATKYQLKDSIDRLKNYVKCINSAVNIIYFKPIQIKFIQKIVQNCQKNQNKSFKLFHEAVMDICPNRGTFLKDLNDNTKFFSRKVIPLKSQIFNQLLTIDTRQIQMSQSRNIEMSITKHGNQVLKLKQLLNKLQRQGKIKLTIFLRLIQTVQTAYFDEIDSLKKQQKNQYFLQLSNNLQTILDEYQEKKFKYFQNDKYEINRQIIYKQIKQCFIEKEFKQKTFIDRVKTMIRILQIFRSWDAPVIAKNKKSISDMKLEFQSICLSIYHILYKKTKDIFVEYVYQVQRFFNQCIIIEMIIIDIQQKHNITIKDLIYKSIDMFVELDKQKYLQKSLHQDLSVQLLNYHLSRHPMAIRNQQNQEELINELKKYSLSRINQFQCIYLKVKFIQKKYYLLVQTLNLNLEQFKNIHKSNKQSEILRFLQSNILCLVELKPFYQLLVFNEFKCYENQTLVNSKLTWNCFIKALCMLIKEYTSKGQQKSSEETQKVQEMFEILVQCMGPQNNSSEVIQFIENYIQNLQKNINSLLLSSNENKQKSPQKRVNEHSLFQNKIKSYQTKLHLHLLKKKKKSTELIKIKITLASIYNSLGLKQKALITCYQAQKYIQFNIDLLLKLNSTIKSIKLNGIQINQGMDNLKIFESSLKLKKLLAKFIKNNKDIAPYKIFEKLQ